MQQTIDTQFFLKQAEVEALGSVQSVNQLEMTFYDDGTQISGCFMMVLLKVYSRRSFSLSLSLSLSSSLEGLVGLMASVYNTDP